MIENIKKYRKCPALRDNPHFQRKRQRNPPTTLIFSRNVKGWDCQTLFQKLGVGDLRSLVKVKKLLPGQNDYKNNLLMGQSY